MREKNEGMGERKMKGFCRLKKDFITSEMSFSSLFFPGMSKSGAVSGPYDAGPDCP